MPRDKSEVRIKDFEKPIIYNISIPHKYNYIYRVSKKTLWKFNRWSCIMNVAKQL
jgi:hypothetical protein